MPPPKPRSFSGTGQAPTHVSAIACKNLHNGAFVIKASTGLMHRIPFVTRQDFLTILRKLVGERVPLAVGSMSPGPADEASLLVDAGELKGAYLEINFLAAEKWTVREMPPGAKDWEKVTDLAKVVNLNFNAVALQQSLKG